MENHPIPQDVTGFQFKLIGNMTVKQFAYLATGAVFAWILLQLPINVLIKFPLGAFSAIFGAALAFFPVSGRPMDLMIGNYIKALFRPTQFVYEKVGGQIYFPNKVPLATMKNIRQYKNGLNIFPEDKLKTYLESLDAGQKNKSNIIITRNLNIPQVTPQINPITGNDTPPTETAPPPLEEKKVIAPQPNIGIPPVPALIRPPVIRTSKGNKSMGMLSIPDSPSLVTGITRDSRGNALPNILIEVKDKDGNPVRAFKTNEFGRFASATPLANGAYAVEFEDPKAQNRFEKITINVAGQIIPPLEVISIDAREELRRSLFASSSAKN